MLDTPGVIVRLPALQLNQTEEAANHIGLIVTGTVHKASLGHLRTKKPKKLQSYLQ